MAKALARGLPEFISELRTVMATITVHRIGLKPSTNRKGMLRPCTRTTVPTLPNRLASAGWAIIASTVPRPVMAKMKLSAVRSSPNLPSMKTLRYGMT